jgi:hypothetical protein
MSCRSKVKVRDDLRQVIFNLNEDGLAVPVRCGDTRARASFRKTDLGAPAPVPDLSARKVSAHSDRIHGQRHTGSTDNRLCLGRRA